MYTKPAVKPGSYEEQAQEERNNKHRLRKRVSIALARELEYKLEEQDMQGMSELYKEQAEIARKIKCGLSDIADRMVKAMRNA